MYLYATNVTVPFLLQVSVMNLVEDVLAYNYPEMRTQGEGGVDDRMSPFFLRT